MIVDLEKKWLPQARCRGVENDLFFPDHGVDVYKSGPTPSVAKHWERAKDFCLDCPVMLQCGRDFLGEIEGVYGGYDPIERRRLRLAHSTTVNDLPPGPRRREYARLAYQLRSNPRYKKGDVERLMGLREGTVNSLVEDHTAYLEAQQRARIPRRIRRATGRTATPIDWPSGPPESADAWVHYHGTVIHAHYLGETEDGAWLYMKGPISGKEDSMSWFRKKDVKLTRKVSRTVRRRVGETSRIYGTTISPRHGAATKAG